jgi:DNA-binding IclR family transcriptional regulator
MAANQERQGIQSVEVGVRLLRALADASAAMTLKDLAAAAGMPASKAHRYLVSFGRAGLVTQDATTGRYDLGALALAVGLAALGRISATKVGAWAAATLRDRIDETTLIAVWGNRGPTIIGWEESSKPVTVNVRVGSVMPLLSSATGRVFLAHMPETRTRDLVTAELSRLKAQRRDGPRVPDPKRLVDDVRLHGLGRVDGDLLAGISALAAPVFEHSGKVAFVLTALGPHGIFDSHWDGPIAAAVKDVASAAAARLGGTRTGSTKTARRDVA